MQGRLVEKVDNKIQAFPWKDWRTEFSIAETLNISLMEWTLDHDNLHLNPLLTTDGRAEIRKLGDLYNIRIESLTGDFLMQAPFWKEDQHQKDKLFDQFIDVINACSLLGISLIVVPLVDNGAIETKREYERIIDQLKELSGHLDEKQVVIGFEVDFSPQMLKRFIDHFDPRLFGINFDTGNSAAMGIDPKEEIDLLHSHFKNVHIKDRPLNGQTVPLGHGHADFDQIFSLLNMHDYDGNFILQTARAEDDCHAELIGEYRRFVEVGLTKSKAAY